MSTNSDGCVSSRSMSPQCHMHSSLSSAAPWRTDGCMAPIFTLEDKSTETEAGCLSLLPEEVSPYQQERSPSLVQVKLEPLVQIKEEQRQSVPSLVQVKLEPPQIKEEQHEFLHRPEEAAGSTLTLLAVKREDDEDRETEPLASTSTERTKTQADVGDCGASQPTGDQLLSSRRSESDAEDSDFWEETREDQDLKSSKQTPSNRTNTGKKSCRCTECGRVFSYTSLLKRHMRTHTGPTGEKPFNCTVCSKGYASLRVLNTHMNYHAGEYTCAECGKVFVRKFLFEKHVRNRSCEKVFTCAECGKYCISITHLKAHTETHTVLLGNPTNLRPFVSNCLFNACAVVSKTMDALK